MPELLDAVTPSTMEAVGTEGMTPCEGSEGERWRGEGLAGGPS